MVTTATCRAHCTNYEANITVGRIEQNAIVFLNWYAFSHGQTVRLHFTAFEP